MYLCICIHACVLYTNERCLDAVLEDMMRDVLPLMYVLAALIRTVHRYVFALVQMILSIKADIIVYFQ